MPDLPDDFDFVFGEYAPFDSSFNMYFPLRPEFLGKVRMCLPPLSSVLRRTNGVRFLFTPWPYLALIRKTPTFSADTQSSWPNTAIVWRLANDP